MKKLLQFLLIYVGVLITLPLSGQVTEEWVVRYNDPINRNHFTSMALDGAGNIYVTGNSYNGSNWDYATVKYDASGVEQWVRRYNGPSNGDDFVAAMTVDSSGNTYVTGVTGAIGEGAFGDYATVKYNSSGVQQWVGIFNGPVKAVDIAIDGAGNSYVTGYSHDGIQSDHVTVKFNPSGVQQWVRRYNGLSNGDDHPGAIAVDGSGNVYVAGSSFDRTSTDRSGSRWDYTTLKYDASGVQQWVRFYNGPASHDDRFRAMSIDGSGNVYVTGNSTGSIFNFDFSDYATVKYNASGVQQWVSRYGGPDNRDDSVHDLALDGSGNVYVTGSSRGGFGNDYATVKYDASGVQQWVSRYNGPDNLEDSAHGIALDGSGNVYVTGSSQSFSSDAPNTTEATTDYATVKYDASGAEQWVKRYNSPNNGNDAASAIAVDGSDVYVSGTSLVHVNGASISGYATVKYSQFTEISSGFVTGNGWIHSPKGAYFADHSLTGKAMFNFVVKHPEGPLKPTGKTKFKFKAGNLNFRSTSYNSLVISGASALFKGEGRINGRGKYGFLISMVDGAIEGDGIDRFRIKIWKKSNGKVIYDNEKGALDKAESNTEIAGGSIVIHKLKAGLKSSNKNDSGAGLSAGSADKPQENVRLEGTETLKLRVYPNPVEKELFIDFESDYEETVAISIFDMAGRKLYGGNRSIVKGANHIVLDITNWNATSNQLLFSLMSPSTGFHHLVLLKP